jgi:SAM-dependent methyltransferase
MTVEAPAHPREAACRAVVRCRFCDGDLGDLLCDLGRQPLANGYVDPADAHTPDPAYPLAVRVCSRCRLAQLDHIVDARSIFRDYAYFSSVSSTWDRHTRHFVEAAVRRFRLGRRSFVVEVASNDGGLLSHVMRAGVGCLGVEPAANVAAQAIANGVPTMIGFFGKSLADEIVSLHGHADLVVANNVLAHVPDLNDFVAGLARLAGQSGTVSIETPHLARLVTQVQFDTIYHEHYAYWSFHAAERVLAAHGLHVFDIERLSTHGGSLRILAKSLRSYETTPRLAAVRVEECCLGLEDGFAYHGFQRRVLGVLDGFAAWLDSSRRDGHAIAAYGAAAKGNTFLNAACVGAADIPCVADAGRAKQGRLLPGSRIPVVTPQEMLDGRPYEVLALPWNIADEIAAVLHPMREWGGRMVTAIPEISSRPV